MQSIIIEKHSNQINTPWWKKKRARHSQIVKLKENLKLSNDGFSFRLASGTNPPIKALRQSRHRAWGLTHRRAIKEGTIAINCDWV